MLYVVTDAAGELVEMFSHNDEGLDLAVELADEIGGDVVEAKLDPSQFIAVG